MSKQLYIMPEKCVACRTCELTCSFSHNQEFNPRLSCVTVVNYEDEFMSVPVMCLQCEEAHCMKICPEGALHRDEDGTVLKDPNKCIVCKMCVNACPLGNMSYSPEKNKVFKCDLCFGKPKCATLCPTGAIQFIDPTEVLERKKTIAGHLKDAYMQEESK